MADRLKQARKARPVPVWVVNPEPEASEDNPGRGVEWLGVMFSLIALLVAGFTYFDQRDLKAITETRYKQRYVDRVAWWMGNDFNKPGEQPRLVIQNRSTAPIRGVAFEGVYPSGPGRNNGRPIAYATFNIPPCVMVELPLPKEGREMLQVLRVSFKDAQNERWVKDRSGGLDDNAATEHTKYVDEVLPEKTRASRVVLVQATKDLEDCTDA